MALPLLMIGLRLPASQSQATSAKAALYVAKT